jgi:hypothetical protein
MRLAVLPADDPCAWVSEQKGQTIVRRVSLALVFVFFAVVASGASASQLIDRNAKGVKLAVNAKGEAMLTYTAGGKLKHVLAWGAVNAIAPTEARAQVAFKLDYSGGYGKYRRDYWKTFGKKCGAYDGPDLHWAIAGVRACKAPDGSYWAVQAWQRSLPNYGVAPLASQAVWELRLSHWTGEVATLDVSTDWAWHQWDHLYGTFSYDGSPVHGFKSTAGGQPLDTFGRNLYVDTFDSAYGQGWKRENSFLVHNPTGAFCYSVNPHGARPAGTGTRYRATVIGPGVTPDVYWEGASPGTYDKSADLIANDAIASLGDKLCRAN